MTEVRTAPARYEWERYWSDPEAPTALIDDGFLFPPDPARGLHSEDLKHWGFEEISDHRCLILVGEPGIGKSDAINREAELIEERCAGGEGERILPVDLGSTREESVLRKEISGSRAFREWSESEGELHLFLDSFDEAVLPLKRRDWTLAPSSRTCANATLSPWPSSRSRSRCCLNWLARSPLRLRVGRLGSVVVSAERLDLRFIGG